jgi:HEAT repeat protein
MSLTHRHIAPVEEAIMRTLRASVFVALLCSSAPVLAQEGPVTPEYSRRGELSPGAEAPSQDALVAAIKNGSPQALKSILEYGERVVCEACVPLLSEKLVASENRRVREMSAWWLRRQPFAGPAVVAKLRKDVRVEADATRRARMVQALGELMDPHALPELADAALEDPEPGVRVAAARALARLNSDAGGAVMADLLADRVATVKLAALEGLLTLRSFREHDALVPLLGDDDADVRMRAARLCGELKVADAAGALIAALRGDESPKVRQAAAWSLGRIGGADAQTALREAKAKEQDDRVLDAIAVAERMR